MNAAAAGRMVSNPNCRPLVWHGGQAALIDGHFPGYLKLTMVQRALFLEFVNIKLVVASRRAAMSMIVGDGHGPTPTKYKLTPVTEQDVEAAYQVGFHHKWVWPIE